MLVVASMFFYGFVASMLALWIECKLEFPRVTPKGDATFLDPPGWGRTRLMKG